MAETIYQRLSAYFSRPVAEKGAKSLSSKAQIEIRVTGAEPTAVTLARQDKRNVIIEGPARDPDLIFTLSERALAQVLADPTEDLGELGVNLLKLVMSHDPELKMSMQVKAGFLGLFSKGYFGVLAAGGGPLASYLASKGFNGIDAIKAALKKRK